MVDLKTGDDLREWRKINHLTQPQAAELLSYHSDSISHIERQNKGISKRLRARIECLDLKLNPPNPLDDFIRSFSSLYDKKEYFDSIPDIIEELTKFADIHVGGDLQRVDTYLAMFLESVKLYNQIDDITEEECKERLTKLYKQARTYIQSK